MKGVTRPRKVVLPDSAQIPEQNLRRPPPTRFTHTVAADQPFYYQSSAEAEAAGTFAAGTRVLQLTTSTPLCHVVDERGLAVYTACEGLEPLQQRSRPRARK